MSWKAGNYSKFWGKTLEYGFKHRLGTKKDLKQEQKSLKFINHEKQNITIPEKYDFREDLEVKAFLRKKPIRDQGDCAASWAFSTIGN